MKEKRTKLVPVPSVGIIPERDLDKSPILECRHPGIDFGGLRLPMSNLVDSVRDKQKVRVSVRPEEFVIVGADQPGIDATVEYSTFLGLNTHYVIRLKSGERVEIIQESQIDDIIENGTKIRLGVKAEKINVFNEDGTKSLIV